jgi:hypothetical protein
LCAGTTQRGCTCCECGTGGEYIVDQDYTTRWRRAFDPDESTCNIGCTIASGKSGLPIGGAHPHQTLDQWRSTRPTETTGDLGCLIKTSFTKSVTVQRNRDQSIGAKWTNSSRQQIA